MASGDCRIRCYVVFPRGWWMVAFLSWRHGPCLRHQRWNSIVRRLLADVVRTAAGLQAPQRNEQGTIGEDIAIFPLAIPLLSGPGTITTVLLLTNQAAGDISRLGILTAIIAVVYLIAWCVLFASDRVVTRFGEGKVHIIARVLGIVLAALAVQYVLNGLTGYYYSLVGRSA